MMLVWLLWSVCLFGMLHTISVQPPASLQLGRYCCKPPTYKLYFFFSLFRPSLFHIVLNELYVLEWTTWGCHLLSVWHLSFCNFNALQCCPIRHWTFYLGSMKLINAVFGMVGWSFEWAQSVHKLIAKIVGQAGDVSENLSIVIVHE